VQRIPRAPAVLPTRRAISPRLAIRTEVMGAELELVVELCRVLRVLRAFCEMSWRAREITRDLGAEAENIGCQNRLAIVSKVQNVFN
jgi:hypothetical protein